MVFNSGARELAGRLLSWEADATHPVAPKESVPLRVYEKLRLRLSALSGIAGFHSLASRALTLAKSEAPDLTDVRLTADGSLHGLGRRDFLSDAETKKWGDGEAILIARLLELLLIFLGEVLTLNLISDLWPGACPDDRITENGRKT
jgi:hypothetical protein